ncbi:MAG: recombinase family protein [Alphaproteobacteria bacterium]|nr:recombinase family protein [Alphaproteobacteria bacterium]
MPNAVTYCRVSSDEQAAKDISIPAQRKALRRWAALREDLEIIEQFEDQGVSAYAPADRRPGFCQMVAYCRRHDVDFILVHKLDRFSRNQEESILFKSLLRKHGVAVRSITETFDPDTPQGFLYEGMIEVINQFYSMNLATETLKGMREAASRGHYMGGQVPYGYRAVRIDDGGGRSHRELVPGPPEQVETVRRMFRMSADEGKGVRSIAAALNEQDIPSPGGVRWSMSTVHAILRSRIYAGDLVWGKTKKKGRLGRTRAERERWVITEDAHEALVDRALFERCQERLDTRTFDPRSVHHKPIRKYLLSGILRCGHCGHNYVGRGQVRKLSDGSKRYHYRYYCAGYLTKGRKTCASLPLKMHWADDLIVDALRARISAPEALADLEQRVGARIKARRGTYHDEVSELRRKIAEVDGKIANYYRAIGEGVDPLTCQRLIAEQEQVKRRLEAEAELQEDQDYFATAQERCLEELKRLGQLFEQEYGELPAGLRRQIVERFVADMVVEPAEHGDVLRVKLRVPMDPDRLGDLADRLKDRAGAAGSSWASFTYDRPGGSIPEQLRTQGAATAPWVLSLWASAASPGPDQEPPPAR